MELEVLTIELNIAIFVPDWEVTNPNLNSKLGLGGSLDHLRAC